VAFEGAAHEHLHSLALDVQNDGKWNVNITEEVDVMRVCNVVDDESARYKLFIMGVVSVIAVRMLVVSMVRVGSVIVCFLAVVTFVVMVGIRLAVFSAVSVGIVLGMLSMCVVLISVAVVLSQERCSREEKQGGKQGLE
jgi:cell division protein FtsW (lipid II flippase)